MHRLEILMSKLANQRTVKALRKGLMYLMPFTLVGAFSLALFKLPIPAYQNFMVFLFGDAWQNKEILLLIHRGTFSIMSLATLLTVSYAIAIEKKFVKSGEIDIIFVMIAVLACFFIIIGGSDVILSNEMADATNMYRAIIIAIAATHLFCFFYRISERANFSLLHEYNGSALLYTASKVILPAFLTIVTFSFVRVILDWLIYKDLLKFKLIDRIAEKYITGNNFLAAVLFLIAVHGLWFLGIHGGNIFVDAISSATSAAGHLTASSIFTKRFFYTYVYLGGYGATLGLLVALLLTAIKSSENRLAKVSIIPSFLNINESIMFGLPVILNPYFLVPFIATPIILTFITWIAISLNWVPLVTRNIDWTTPIFISGYIGTDGSIAAVVMQAINLIISVLIYIPFVKLQTRDQKRLRKHTFKSLIGEILDAQDQDKRILNRHDEVGALARELVTEIREGFTNGKPVLHLEYQPKTNYEGKVLGAEALLRWNHPAYGYVSPLIILHICEESGLDNQLGTWVINSAFRDLGKWHRAGYRASLSVNLSPLQLSTDEKLVDNLHQCIRENNIDPRYMELEITENATIDVSHSTQSKLEEIRQLGINIAIDDFGMGHSSLLYLTDFHANVIKIDISLIRDIERDIQRQQIVKSILSLSKQIDVLAVAEGVETEEQLKILHNYGCNYYQGFYFSKSLSYHDFIEYMKEHTIIQHIK